MVVRVAGDFCGMTFQRFDFPKVMGFLKVSNVKIYSTVVNQGIMISIGPCSYQNIDS